jgi:hypothetical protein
MQFGPLKQRVRGRGLHSNKEVEVAVRELLRMQQPIVYREQQFNCVPGWGRCFIMLGDGLHLKQ